MITPEKGSVAIQRLVGILRRKGPMRAGELGVEAWASEAMIKLKPENTLLTPKLRNRPTNYENDYRNTND
jgi:hypothetical protein